MKNKTEITANKILPLLKGLTYKEIKDTLYKAQNLASEKAIVA